MNCPGASSWEVFCGEGCPHVAAAAAVDPALAARLRHQPAALSGVAAFL